MEKFSIVRIVYNIGVIFKYLDFKLYLDLYILGYREENRV